MLLYVCQKYVCEKQNKQLVKESTNREGVNIMGNDPI